VGSCICVSITHIAHSIVLWVHQDDLKVLVGGVLHNHAAAQPLFADGGTLPALLGWLQPYRCLCSIANPRSQIPTLQLGLAIDCQPCCLDLALNTCLQSQIMMEHGSLDQRLLQERKWHTPCSTGAPACNVLTDRLQLLLQPLCAVPTWLTQYELSTRRAPSLRPARSSAMERWLRLGFS